MGKKGYAELLIALFGSLILNGTVMWLVGWFYVWTGKPVIPDGAVQPVLITYTLIYLAATIVFSMKRFLISAGMLLSLVLGVPVLLSLYFVGVLVWCSTTGSQCLNGIGLP